MKWKEIFRRYSRYSEKITSFGLLKHQGAMSVTRSLYHGKYEVIVYDNSDGTKLTIKTIPLLKHNGDKEITIWV